MADNLGRLSDDDRVKADFEQLISLSNLGSLSSDVMAYALAFYQWQQVQEQRQVGLNRGMRDEELPQLPELPNVSAIIANLGRQLVVTRASLVALLNPSLFANIYTYLDKEMLTRGPSAGQGFGVLSQIESAAVSLYIQNLTSGSKPRLQVGVAEELEAACSTAFEMIRQDHLHPGNAVKVSPQEWRENADIVCEAIVEKTIREGNLNPEKTTIAISLRSGLALAAAFARRGFHNFVYVDVERREADAAAEIHQKTSSVSIPADHDVVCPDPMLATGGSMAETLTQVGIPPGDRRRIIAVSVISAPEGHFHLARKFPGMQFFTAAVDRCLNEAAFICDGLGDFGNNYFADAVDEILEGMITEWKSIGLLVRADDETMLRKRFKRHVNDSLVTA